MTDDTRASDESTAERTTTEADADWPSTDDGLDPLADRLRERTHSLETTDPAADLTDLDPLVERLRDVRIVGLGEATHGTREFFQLKHRIFRALVEELDYRLFALEANFSETLAIDDYVVHGRGNPKEALDGIYFWTWDTEEVLELIEWLREFNDGRPVEDCVRFYGIDTQFTAGPAEALVDFLVERDPAALDEHRESLEMLADEGLKADESAEEIESRLAAADALVGALEEWFERESPDPADDAFALHRWHLRTLEQAVDVNRAAHEEDTEAGSRRRDRAMAENLSWVLDHEPHDRIAVWAHDAHLQRDGRDEHWGTGTPMGAHLGDRYGDDYYVLGFDFADGEFQAMVETDDGYELQVCSLGAPPEHAATRLFAAVDEPLWWCDIDEVTGDDELAEYLDAERAVRSVGAVYDPDDEHERLHDVFRLPLAFDGLVFVAETSRARPVERD